MVRFRAVSKSYRSGSTTLRVLDEVHWDIAAGEVVVLLGRSGSGKSTLLNLVSGIDLPDSGEIDVAGIALNNADDLNRTLYRRRNIGYVYQDFNLIANLSVRDNMALPLELNNRSGEVHDRTHALAQELGIEDKLDLMPEQLSGGEQQCVAFCRALANKPKVLLADEPTGNLDPATSDTVFAALMDLVRETGLAALIATHNPELAARMDRTVHLENGKLV